MTWQLFLQQRQYASGTAPTVVALISEGRSQKLVQQWNTPATFTFTIDGYAPTAHLLNELAVDVTVWRTNDTSQVSQCVFRGPITNIEDQITQDGYTINVTCQDYLAMLQRRILTSTLTTTSQDQDNIVQFLIQRAIGTTSSSGTTLTGAWLPITYTPRAPSNIARGLSGIIRTRTYWAQTIIGTALDDLARVSGGFDYDIQPVTPPNTYDSLRVFYPQQGVTRTDMALVYGVNVAGLTRTVNASAYANYIRVLGSNASGNPAATQVYAEAWNADASNISTTGRGLWMTGNAAADVTVTATLADKANGDLSLSGVIAPSWTLTLTPGFYRTGLPNMGDVVPLTVVAGRLNVNTTVRVLGLTFDIGDDGQEDVTLTVARPALTLPDLILAYGNDIEALNRT